MKAGKLLLGLISGAAAGAALGLLFAPKKGADTRKTITETGDNYIKGAKEKIDEFADNLNHKMESLKNRAKAETSSSAVEKKINEVKAELEELKSK